MNLNLFKPGMAVTWQKFTGRIIRLDPHEMTVRWDGGVCEVLGQDDLDRKDLRPLFP